MVREINMKNILNIVKFVLIDIFMILISFYLTSAVLGYADFKVNIVELMKALLVIIPFKLIIYLVFGMYRIMPKHLGFEDVVRIILLSVCTNIFIVISMAMTGFLFITKSSFIFITSIEVAGLLTPRIFKRVHILFSSRLKWLKTVGTRTLIIGAGEAGEIALREIYKNKELSNIPVAIIDDSEEKQGKKMMGVEVVGKLSDIDEVIQKFRVEEVIIAIKYMDKEKLTNLLNHLLELGVKLKKLNVIEDVTSINEKPKVIDFKVEELLNRDVIKLDNEGIFDFVKHKTVLVTGGGGSIGSELCRQIYNLNPSKLVIFDIYENNAYDIQMELQRLAKKDPKNIYPTLEVRIGSVYNKKRLEEIYEEFRPNLVFHAAAYKHVPLMEDSAVESVRTNVLGTYNAATLANKYNVEKFVLISSDKAVRSTNIMGATKRLAEMIIESEQRKGNTSFSAVRFGNVLGSNGSVIPLFKKQIADGGPITVTHKDITRYFMTIPEAVSLILQCGVYANKGELFILDMGEPVRIYDLAEKMIRLAGYRPNIDMNIEVVGLRPGEKLYEELLVDTKSEQLQKTINHRIFKEDTRDCDLLNEELFVNLLVNFEKITNDEVKNLVSQIVTNYTIQK